MRRTFLAVALLALAAAPPVRAQTPPATPDLVRIGAISPWIDETHPFSMTLQITNTTELSLEEVSVSIEVRGRVASRSQLREALDHGPATPPIGEVSQGVRGSIPPGEQRTVTVSSAPRDFASFARSGVYPVIVRVRHAGGAVEARTAIPYLATAPPAQISIIWILPVTRASVRRGDGIYPVDVAEQLTIAELAQQMNVVAARPGVALTLAPNPSLLDTLADLAGGFPFRGTATVETAESAAPAVREAAAALDAIRRAAIAVGEVAVVPYAPADLPSLAAHGLRADLLRQITLGRSVLQQHLARAPAPAVLVPPNLVLDGASADALAPLGVTGFALAPGRRAPQPAEPFLPDNFGPSRPVAASTRTRIFSAMLPDLPISERIARGEQGVLLAQAIVAETASAWLELPAFAADRALLIAPSQLPSPTALAAALDGLSRAPWVRMRTLSEALAVLAPQAPPAPLLRARPLDRPYLAAARAARASWTTLQSVAVEPMPELDTLDRFILLAESAEWRANASAGVSLADAVRDRVGEVLRGVRVFSDRVVTLTSRTGDVPVTVLNGNDFPLRVRIRVASAKVTFPDGAVRSLDLAPPNRTLAFPVEARAAGSFPLDVRIESPDGKRLIASGRVVVRSTAVSAVALGAVGGGALFLIAAWVGRGFRRRNGARTR